MLELWSGVVEEILPDRSSVEEIEGKLPMLKLKTCFKYVYVDFFSTIFSNVYFRWKGSKPSTVLRLEINLFSGFELTTTPPQLLNPPQDMAEMQHNYHANKLWFIFANVSISCPICVQFVARSAFVITSLRPAYAKIYPASREDLAAEIFFHAQFKSNLLKSVTADDMITWFGANGTNTELGWDVPLECKNKELPPVVTPQEQVATTATTFVPLIQQKVNIVSVPTPNSNIETTESAKLSESDITAVNLTKLSSSNVDAASNILVLTETSVSLSSIEQNTSLMPSTPSANEDMDEKNTIPHEDSIVKFINPSLFVDNITYRTKNDYVTTDISTTADTVTSTIETSFIPTTLSTIRSTMDKFRGSKEIIETRPQVPVKHINKEEVHDIPKKYDKVEEATEEQITFAPEIKNDQYILLDKEALWGMLKEVVDDEFKRKTNSNIMNKEKISQKFT